MRRIWFHLLYYSCQVFIHTDQITLNLPFSKLNTCSLSYFLHIWQSKPLIILMVCWWVYSSTSLSLVLASQELDPAHCGWAERKDHCPKPAWCYCWSLPWGHVTGSESTPEPHLFYSTKLLCSLASWQTTDHQRTIHFLYMSFYFPLFCISPAFLRYPLWNKKLSIFAVVSFLVNHQSGL